MNQKINVRQPLGGVVLPELAPGIVAQLDGYMMAVAALEERRGRSLQSDEVRKRLAMLSFKLWQFVYSRDTRSADSQSPEMQATIAIKKRIFPLGIPRLMLCVDGRVLSKLFAGLHEAAFRTPAGDTAEFVPHREEEGIFLTKGSFSKGLDRLFAVQDMVVEVLDSHLHCAARKEMATDRIGFVPADDGLYLDVIRKKEMTEALLSHGMAERHPNKRLFVFQTSFDPSNGFCFMGLEKDECLTDPRVVASGFAGEVLEALSAEGKIISTFRFAAAGSALREAFLGEFFEIDYETRYRQSARQFWERMERLAEAVLPEVEVELERIYPYLSAQASDDERRERALLLLANAYNAFLHNFDETGMPKAYPYKEHDESVVTVTYGDHGPYDRARSFSVDPGNPNLPYVIRFTAGLVRGNRRAGRLSATERDALSACYGEDIAHYSKNPVPVFFFERTESVLDHALVERLQAVDWSDIADIDWMRMDVTEFERYLDHKLPGIPAMLARKVNVLRERAIALFRPGQSATDDLLDGRLVPVWVLSSPDRRALACLPFLAKGYDEDVVGQY